ncbi:hypothetical protein AB1L42_05280 [Thalassoglobus sp. JC818]|uniref:hypothetical protein n=1 Tax=Thalassoglobus sp. JC818 TaxID=3232136 RepID=UPI0034598143
MAGYEFTQEQNATFSSLAHKMGWVGWFFVVIGVFNLIGAVLLMMAIYRNEIPESYLENIPAEVKAELDKAEIPPQNRLWGFVANAALGGVIYLCIGSWTRSAAASFSQIATTEDRDIPHLMDGLSSLNSMYGLFYTLLMIMLIFFVVTMGMALYATIMS